MQIVDVGNIELMPSLKGSQWETYFYIYSTSIPTLFTNNTGAIYCLLPPNDMVQTRPASNPPEYRNSPIHRARHERRREWDEPKHQQRSEKAQ